MKKLVTALLCLALLTATLASCDFGSSDKETTAADTTAAEADTTAAEGDTTAEGDTAAEDDTTAAEDDSGEEDPSEPVAGDLNISTAEELMAFNKSINEDYEDYADCTIAFTADIDMAGYEWIPLDSYGLNGVTFEGNGHTISNLKFVDYAPETGTPATDMGCGFIGVNVSTLTFRNLTFANASVTAYERHVGCIIGINVEGSAYVTFENVHVNGFKADGWMDYNGDIFPDEQHPISFRLAGFVGSNAAGFVTFTGCSAKNLELSGFHNLAGFVGYDGSRTMDAYCFEECVVEDCKFTFSYCLSDSYTVDMPRRFVSVFYNGADWIDNIDAVVELGNSYSNVYHYDWTDNNAEYEASEFRSWTQEEKDAAAAA